MLPPLRVAVTRSEDRWLSFRRTTVLVVSALTVGLGTCCEPPSGLDRWVVDLVHFEPVVRRYSGRQPSSYSNCNISGNAVGHAVEETRNCEARDVLQRWLTTVNLEYWEGPYTVRWVMNGTAAAPWFQPVVQETAAKSGQAPLHQYSRDSCSPHRA